MSKPAIKVEGLCKEYVIGSNQGAGQTFREALTDSVMAPVKRLLGRGAVPAAEERFWALQDVSFAVAPGEVLGIIGRNGAGKSTLLKVLSRITAPTKGRIEINGRIASLLEVGTGFHPELTGRENIRLNGAILGMSGAEIRSKFDAIVDFAGVEKFLDTPVKRYSSGMYVRLAFAVAAHLEPEILIIDEVLAVGDAEFQKKCLGKMGEVAKGGRTVLFVSHNMAAVRGLCSRALLMRHGQLDLDGESTPVISSYLADVSSDVGRTDTLDRPRWAAPWIRHVDTKSVDGRATRQFSFGESIVVDVHIESPDGASIATPVLGFILRDATNQAVTGISTRISGQQTTVATQRGVIRCVVDKPNLVHGQYSMELWLQAGLANVDTISVMNVFEVNPTDIYGSGVFPDPAHGPVHLKATWTYADA